jgi:acyl-coenzyme A synthetase/AMP-(fatty) acid ligase
MILMSCLYFACVIFAFHVGALFVVIGSVYRGYSLIVMKNFAPKQFWQVITAEKISLSGGVPAMLNAMIQIPAVRTKDVSQFR